jgi:hypothetical protein
VATISDLAARRIERIASQFTFMKRMVVWQPWDEFGAEYLEVSADASGVRVVGSLIRRFPSGPVCIEYLIECDATWQTRAAEVTLLGVQPVACGSARPSFNSALTSTSPCRFGG